MSQTVTKPRKNTKKAAAAAPEAAQPKVEQPQAVPTPEPVAEKKPDFNPADMREPNPVPRTEAEMIAESREALKFPPPPDHIYFESPEGYIVLGEAKNGRVWCNKANGGKGMWINPRRGGSNYGK